MVRDDRLVARSGSGGEIEVHDVAGGTVWIIAFSGDDTLGSRFSLGPRDEEGTFYGFVSWVGPSFGVLLQDPDESEHRYMEIEGSWPFEDFDLGPLDDPANAEELARLLVRTILVTIS